jgi:Tol biopolymer transport system component
VAGPQRRLSWLFISGSALAIAVIATVVGAFLWRRDPSPAAGAEQAQPLPLTSYAGSERAGGFSLDVNQVVFSWDGEAQDNVDICIKLIGPGTPLRLTADPAVDDTPRWSPDGRSIVFDSNAGGAYHLYIVAAEGGRPRPLTTGTSRNFIGSWSPDGQWMS